MREALIKRYVREWLGAVWGEEKAREYLHKAGFRHVQTNQPAHHIQDNRDVVRK